MIAPMPYFGGKRRVAAEVWRRFGPVRSYVEPFAGSLAVLLARPEPIEGVETVNDLDGLLANFWRSVKADPEAVAHHADWPVNEVDLHARHAWLVGRKDELRERLLGDPEAYDAKVAGWWVWGLCSWIGNGWCSGEGPWTVEDGRLAKQSDAKGEDIYRPLPHLGDAGRGIHRKRPHLGDAGRGIHRQLPHLGDAGKGIYRQLLHLGDAGKGVHRQIPQLRNTGMGVHRIPDVSSDASEGSYALHAESLRVMMTDLADRLRRVRVCCGDWSRVCGPAVTYGHGLAGVFLDPPYGEDAGRDMRLYAEDSGTVAAAARAWALANGDDPRLRIALCGYEFEHDMPASWSCHAWKAKGGYGSLRRDGTNPNAARERVWFSPHCLAPRAATSLLPGFE